MYEKCLFKLETGQEIWIEERRPLSPSITYPSLLKSLAKVTNSASKDEKKKKSHPSEPKQNQKYTSSDSYSLDKKHAFTSISFLWASRWLLEASGRKSEGPWLALSCWGYGLCFCSWCIECSNFYCLTKHPPLVFRDLYLYPKGFIWNTRELLTLEASCSHCQYMLYNHAESVFLVFIWVL